MLPTEQKISPVLKWAGGKRKLWPEIAHQLPATFNTYFEPFLGGAAILFALQPPKAVVNDYNPEIINLLRVIQDRPQELIELLEDYQTKNDLENFYRIRGLDRNSTLFQSLSPIQKAARIIYLNRTCFNGLYRVNAQGQFNVSFGGYPNPLINQAENILQINQYLNQNDVSLLNGDFEAAVKTAQTGDFIYFDPPYYPISKTAAFISYAQNSFGQTEQERLRELCDQLTAKKVNFLLSNSYCPAVFSLYKNYEIITVQAQRAINSNGAKRGKINEVLVKNY